LVLAAIIYGQTSIAKNRARLLPCNVLTDDEYQQLITSGYVEIATRSRPTRTFHIPPKGGRAQMFEQGQLVCELCHLPTRCLPLSDLVMAHKVQLEGDEEFYLATANRFIPEVNTANTLPVSWACYWSWVR
jgi:hypothetical protein